jgi:hypothetical protein
MESIADRLRRAIADRFGTEDGVQKFAAAMKTRAAERQAEGRPLRGASRAMIFRFLAREEEKRVDPSVDFLVEAARVLGRDFGWLATGRDPLDDIVAEDAPPANEFDAVDSGLRNAFPWLTVRLIRSHVATILGEVPRRILLNRCTNNPELQDDSSARMRLAGELGERMGKALAAPLQHLGIDPERMNDRELEAYCLAVAYGLGTSDLWRLFEGEWEAGVHEEQKASRTAWGEDLNRTEAVP